VLLLYKYSIKGLQNSAKCEINQGDLVYILKSSDLFKKKTINNTIQSYMDLNQLNVNCPQGHIEIINQYKVGIVLKKDTRTIFNFDEYYCIIRIMSSSYNKIFQMLDLLKEV